MTIAFAAATLILLGQTEPIDPPIANRPVDFSNIVGAYRLRVTATPTDVQVEEPIMLRVLITGDGPAKYRPNRKYLKLFPKAFERDFYVQEMRDEHQVDLNKKTWLFVYRLKPRREKVESIDGITMVYYDPNHVGQNKFITAFADTIPITVMPKADTTGDIAFVLNAPDSFFTADNTENVLGRGAPPTMSGMHLALGLVLPPLLCFAAAFAWRWWHGDGMSRDRTRRLVAQSLMQRLQVNTAPWKLVRMYLDECFGFPAQDATPIEVAGFLRQRGFAKAVRAQARAFFERCDAERFAPNKAMPHTSEEAVRLIEALEADPCARG